jgi:hypothetical protein
MRGPPLVRATFPELCQDDRGQTILKPSATASPVHVPSAVRNKDLVPISERVACVVLHERDRAEIKRWFPHSAGTEISLSSRSAVGFVGAKPASVQYHLGVEIEAGS